MIFGTISSIESSGEPNDTIWDPISSWYQTFWWMPRLFKAVLNAFSFKTGVQHNNTSSTQMASWQYYEKILTNCKQYFFKEYARHHTTAAMVWKQLYCFTCTGLCTVYYCSTVPTILCLSPQLEARVRAVSVFLIDFEAAPSFK